MNAIDPRRSFGLDNRMTVVLFAGMGGGCDGLERAGFQVHLAVNHDPVAVALHQKRHPHTKHLRCDVFEVDPREATKGRGVRNLHASPDCTHFSPAKGGKPVSRHRRSLAWVVPRWAGQVRPETITLENVPEIQTWGPLIAKRDKATGRAMRLDGTVAAKGERIPVGQQWLIPDPKHKGRIWRAWLKHMRALGYHYEGKVLVCADFGIATIRKRYFGVAQSDGSPIIWPDRTHAPIAKAKALGLKPWVGADTIINWALPVRSIFGRKKSLAEATMRRIARGFVRHVLDSAEPYIMPITHSGGADRARSKRLPLVTITTAHRGEQAVIVPQVAAFLDKYAENAIGSLPTEPLHTVMAGAPRHAVVAASFMAQHNTMPDGGIHPGRAMVDPLSAVTVTGSQQSLIAASMLNLRGTDRAGRSMRAPLATLTAGGTHAGVIAAELVEADAPELAGTNAHLILGFIQAYFSTGGMDQGLASPLSALTTKARHGLVTITLNKLLHAFTDIGSRMLEPEEGAAAHGFEDGCLDHEIEIFDARKGRVITRKLNKTEKYEMVGNSVPPDMIMLLANCNVRRELMVAAE